MGVAPTPDNELLKCITIYENAGKNWSKGAKVANLPRSTFQARVYAARKKNIFPNHGVEKTLWSKFCKPNKNGNILFISDLHVPHHHPDALSFLGALKQKYDFSRIISVGDELDWASLSYHEKDPDMDSAGRELLNARQVMLELHAIFPVMDIIESNHGSLAYRKAVTHGFPKHLITSYADTIFGDRDSKGNLFRRRTLGAGWRWHPKLILDLGSGHKCMVVHGDGSANNTMRNVTMAGMSIVQGHWHSTFDLQYHSTSEFLHFGITVGCLIDPHSAAFNYGKKRLLKRPIIGCAGFIDGHPRLLPMPLAKGGRWTNQTP